MRLFPRLAYMWDFLKKFQYNTSCNMMIWTVDVHCSQAHVILRQISLCHLRRFDFFSGKGTLLRQWTIFRLFSSGMTVKDVGLESSAQVKYLLRISMQFNCCNFQRSVVTNQRSRIGSGSQQIVLTEFCRITVIYHHLLISCYD